MKICPACGEVYRSGALRCDVHDVTLQPWSGTYTRLDTTAIDRHASPPGAAVVVDGEQRPELTPVTLVLEPGPHTIRVSMAGALPAEHTVEVEPEETVAVAMSLDLPAAAVTVEDVAPPEPTVQAPSLATLLPPPGAAPSRASLQLAPDEVVTVQMSAPPSAARRRARRGLAGLGVASLVGGGAVGVLALRDVASADPDRHARGERRAWIADGMFLVGAATLVVAWRVLREPPAPVTANRDREDDP